MKPRSPAITVLPALLTLVTLLFAGRCLAQGAPPVLTIRPNAPLTESGKLQLKAYTEYWCSLMTSSQSTPSQIKSARGALIRPLRSALAPTPAFLFDYSTLIVKDLDDLLESTQSPHATFNALIVYGELGSRHALNKLVKHSDSNSEPRRDIRIKASMNCLKLLTYNAGGLKPREINSGMRGLRNAASRETDPIALRHQLLAILSIETPAARDAAVVVLKNVVEKIAEHEDGTSPLIEPFYVAVAKLRNIVINLRGPQKRAIGLTLGPCLNTFLTTASVQWDSAHQTEDDVQRFAKPIRTSEAILKIIINATPNISPPTTTLRTNWEDHQKKHEFTKEVNQWDSLLKLPPFAR